LNETVVVFCLVILVMGLIIASFSVGVIIYARKVLCYPVIILSILFLYITFLIALFLFDLFALILGYTVIGGEFMEFMIVVLPLIYPLVALSALRTVTTPPPKSPDRRPLYVSVVLVWIASLLTAFLSPKTTDFSLLHNVLNGVCFFISFTLFTFSLYQVRKLNSVRPALFNFASACIGIFFLCWCLELVNIVWLTLIAVHITFFFTSCLALLLLLRASTAASTSSSPMPWSDWPWVKKSSSTRTSSSPKPKPKETQITSRIDQGSNV